MFLFVSQRMYKILWNIWTTASLRLKTYISWYVNYMKIIFQKRGCFLSVIFFCIFTVSVSERFYRIFRKSRDLTLPLTCVAGNYESDFPNKIISFPFATDITYQIVHEIIMKNLGCSQSIRENL